MAAGKAQRAIGAIARLVRKHGIDLRFAIHPLAGRLPGHMNVLLAEARVPYDIVFLMDATLRLILSLLSVPMILSTHQLRRIRTVRWLANQFLNAGKLSML